MKTMQVSKSSLNGTVQLSGAKNSALKLLTASLLTGQEITIENYPSTLSDAMIHVDMLRCLGKECVVEENRIVISEPRQISSSLAWRERSIRNTLLILGCLTARTGSGAVPLPGGCPLGDRKYDLHVMLLEKLGARVFECDGMLCAEASSGLVGGDIVLPLRSTGATENAILCGCLAKGRTTIWNPHIRPEIMDLISMLKSMGAEVEVFGQERIEIVGQSRLHGAQHRTIPDNMEALTWLIGAAVTGGEVELRDFPFEHLEVPLIHLRESGVNIFRCGSTALVRGGRCYPVDISTGAYPGINSDMQPLFAVFGSQGRGCTKIVDLRFVNRYAYAAELAKMGLVYEVRENTLVIDGGRPFHGAEVVALDLRAGAALFLAGLVAGSPVTILDAWQIERGYNRFVQKAQQLGAAIKVID